MTCNYTHHDEEMQKKTHCTSCGQELACTIYDHVCSNPECPTYNTFGWGKCGICGAVRVFCSC